MKKKILLFIALISAFVCLFAISSSAETVYKESADSEVLFSGTFDGAEVVSYDKTKRFPLTDENGNALTWYLTGATGTDTDGNTVKYVTKDLTKNLFDTSTGNYIGGKTFAKTVVSANFDNDGTVTKFATGLFGGISDYSTELLFVYVPDSVEKIPYRFCQYVKSVLEINFNETSKCKEFEGFFALDAKSLRVASIPPLLEVIPLTETKYGQFQGCSRLETINFVGESHLREIGGNAFSGTNVTSVTLPNSVEIVSSKAFQGARYLKYLNLGANFKCFKAAFYDWFSFTYEVGDLGEGTLTLVLPGNAVTLDTNNMSSSERHFGYMFPRAINIQYAGTEEEYAAFVKVITETTYNGTNTYRDNGGLKSSTVTYVNACDVFYGGVHQTVDEVNDHNCTTDDKCRCRNLINPKTADAHTEFFEIVYTDYSKAGKKSHGCSNADCTIIDVDDSIDAIFTTKGYSIKNDGCGITTDYELNKKALEEYRAYLEESGKTFEIGVFLGNSNYFGETFVKANGSIDNEYGFSSKVSANDYSKIKCTVADFTTDEKDLTLVMGLYVIDDGKVSYVQHEGDYGATEKRGETALDVVTISKIATITGVDLVLPEPKALPVENKEN